MLIKFENWIYAEFQEDGNRSVSFTESRTVPETQQMPNEHVFNRRIRYFLANTTLLKSSLEINVTERFTPSAATLSHMDARTHSKPADSLASKSTVYGHRKSAEPKCSVAATTNK